MEDVNPCPRNCSVPIPSLSREERREFVDTTPLQLFEEIERKGGRKILLSELNFFPLKRKISALLSESRTGNWKDVGAYFGIDHKILKGLEKKNTLPGQFVLNYLNASRPKLTVSEFCRVMKMKKRHDILELIQKEIPFFHVPPEILARGPKAKEAYRHAMKEGKVQVYRGRIMLIGQHGAGKTSLKKSLLGLPFNPKEPSTVGVDVDPSSFSVDVDNVIRWKKLEDNSNNSFVAIVARKIADSLRKLLKFKATPKPVVPELPSRLGSPILGVSANRGLDDSNDSDDSDDSDDVDITELPLPQRVAATKTENRLSEDVIENVIKYLSKTKNEELSLEDKVQVSVWDFAGQQLYYASHPVFFSPRAVYLLVLNLNKDLKADVEPCERQGVYDTNLDTHEKQTNIESILSWLVSVHSARPENNGKSKDGKELPYLRPPVIIVGTHADCPSEEPKKMEKMIQKSITGKSYDDHVVKAFIAVDNKSEDKKGVQKVRNQMQKLFEKEPYIGEYVPVRWFIFEKVIKNLVDEKGINHLPLGDVEKIVFEDCNTENQDEIAAMLNYYHDLGVIVKYGNLVVLNAEWLIDLFKRLITINHYNEQDPRHRSYWKKLEDTGILDMGLVEHVFDDAIKSKGSDIKEDILAMMERYALIAKFGTADDFQYFVPAQLQSSPGELLDAEPKESDPCTLYLQFKDGFVPHGLYYSLVSKLIAWCSEKQYLKEPKLFQNVSRFAIGCSNDYELLLICRKPFIKVVLRSLGEERSSTFKPAISVLECLRNCIDTLKNDCLGYRSISYDITVRCPTCSKVETKCQKHKFVKCQDDGCLHLLPAKNDQYLFCEEAFRKVKVPGLDEWYRDPSTEQQQAEVQEQAQPLEVFVGPVASPPSNSSEDEKKEGVGIRDLISHVFGDASLATLSAAEVAVKLPLEGSSTVSNIRAQEEFIKEKLGLKSGDKIDDFFGKYEHFALDQPQHRVSVSELEETIMKLKFSIGAIIAMNISSKPECGATCSRIGTKYVLTNKHVVDKIKDLGIQWKSCYVDFNYEVQAPPPAADRFRFNFAPNPELFSSEELDYAILELNPEGRNLPPSLVDPDSGFNIAPPGRQLQGGERLTFIGHPGKLEKQIDVSCPIKVQQDIQTHLHDYYLFCLIQNGSSPQDYATYDVSTFFEGSSGSPGVLMKGKLLVVLQSSGIPLQGTNKRHVLEFGPLMSSVVKDVIKQINNRTVENVTRVLDEVFGGKTSSTFNKSSEPMDTD